MERRFDRRAPILVILDPEGPHLAWETVEALSRFKEAGRYRVEQLILFPTDGYIRELAHRTLPVWAERDLRRLFGNDEWRPIYERRRKEEVSGEQARTEYLQLYERQLRDLGYATVLERPIRMGGLGGRILYFLVFATDNQAGERIMDSCFDHVPESDQLTLGFKMPRPRYGQG